MNAMIRLIAQFPGANGAITIDIIYEPGGAIEIQQKLLTLIAAGEAPDVYWAHSYTNAGQAKRDVQLDLTAYIDGDDDISADQFLPAAWNDSTSTARRSASRARRPAPSSSTTRICSTKPAFRYRPTTGPGTIFSARPPR